MVFLSKRKKVALNADDLEASYAGMGITDGKVSLYHCNYCKKNISGKIHIKCAVCQDFDLCIECFFVGAELTPHKSNHPYRVMDSLSFPLTSPDWSAGEEKLLIEAIDMYGFGNWNGVAENVGTKSKSQCIDHYNSVYLNSPCFPLPDLSYSMGKNKEELLAMAKGHQLKKGLLLDDRNHNFSEESKKAETTNQNMSRPTSARDEALPSITKKASNVNQNNDGVKVEESQAGWSAGEKKPKLSGEYKPSMEVLRGYNSNRGEFEIEYDNDAEQVLAEMEFKDTDTEAEREMKLQVLRGYGKKLNERKRRKEFILERNLLCPDPFEKFLSPEELQICEQYKVFMRFHSKEEHEELLQTAIREHRLAKRIKDLKEARIAGCVTSDEAYQFIEQKRTKEAEQGNCKESGQIGTSGKTESFPSTKDAPPAIQAITKTLEEWDISDFEGAELLSESEIKLCNEIRMLPPIFLNITRIMQLEISKGRVTKKSDAYPLFKFSPSKIDRIYDMLVEKGVVQA
ncbi:transcriptional adapter ADA2a [Medicago truncatula]|uniref:Transcriptional adapter n=1 Tax=Medicago truncatula TaxID=3880 RepID=A0A072V1B9_MEDTR|nr:transcriptional adapter ADA2a [Medicago truncatula]